VANELIPDRAPTANEALLVGTSSRPKWLRPVAVILIAYGIVGVLIGIVLLAIGLHMWPILQALPAQLAASLRATALTVGAAAAAASGATASLNQAQQVAQAASQTAQQASDNVRQLGQAMDIQVFGARPFGELVPRFTDTANNLQQLGTSLSGTSQALALNSAQTGTMQDNLNATQQELNQLAEMIDTDVGSGVPILVLVGAIWVLQLVQAVLILVAGVVLLRR
jgi:hypothetical protein